jgi:hypothetical protein
MSVALLLLATVLLAEGEVKPASAPAGATAPAAKPAAEAKPAAPAAKPAAEATPAAPAAKAPATKTAPGKLPPEVGKEMTEAIVAVSKSLGLESWPSHGVAPCVDRGGQGITAKSVSPEETRKCAMTALEKNFPELGKSYVLAVPMVALGPVTVFALGTGDNADWSAYSCDPQRKCAPVKLSAPSKWGKRMAERRAKACGEETTLWFPADQKACGAPATASVAK